MRARRLTWLHGCYGRGLSTAPCSMDGMARDLEELAFDISSRRLDKQERLLGDVRARAGMVLGASSLAVSFLGRPAAEAEPVLLAVIAVVSFGACVLTALYVLMPKRNLIFSLVGSRVFEELYGFRQQHDEVYRRLAYDLDRFWEENEAVVQRMLAAFRVSAWALVAEIVLLLASVTGTLS